MGFFFKPQGSLKKRTSDANIKRLSKRISIDTIRTNYDERPWEDPYISKKDFGMTNGAAPGLPRRMSSLSYMTAAPREPTTTPATSRLDSKTPTSTKTVDSEDPDAITPAPLNINRPPVPIVRVDEITGHSNVTIPAKPPKKRALSELVDIDAMAPDSQVRSPSGNLLSLAEARAREDRPKSIKERQEAIRHKVQEQMESNPAPMPAVYGNETVVVGDAKNREKKQLKRENRMRKVKMVFLCQAGF